MSEKKNVIDVCMSILSILASGARVGAYVQVCASVVVCACASIYICVCVQSCVCVCVCVCVCETVHVVVSLRELEVLKSSETPTHPPPHPPAWV